MASLTASRRKIIHTVVPLIELRSDDTGIDLGHKICEHWRASLRIEVASVLRSVRYDPVHLVELLARNCVCDERGLVERLIVSTLGLDADIHHLFKGQLHTSPNHRNHQHCVVKVLLLWDLHAPRGSLLEARLCSLSTPFEEVRIAIVPILHHG